MAKELQVISDCYELTCYLTGRIEKFPRHHRYSLGVDMEGRLRTVLALLIRAKYAGKPDGKAALLGDANVELAVVRFQLRLAKNLANLPLGSHGHAIQLISQVGVQVGGWLKSLRKPVQASS